MSREYLIYGDPATTLVTIVGDDTPGMTITPRTLDVDEGGTTMYTVKLNGLPTENVTVARSPRIIRGRRRCPRPR